VETAVSNAVGARITVFEDNAALSRAAASLLADAAGRSIRERGKFSAALYGGSTPLALYVLLGANPSRHHRLAAG
jgi:6-phosphogluconolactonase